MSKGEKEIILDSILNINIEVLKGFSIGELYQSSISSKEKKELGQVYTPKEIVKSMVREGITEERLINNPYFKAIDPACGAGYFLIEIYDRLYSIFERNYKKIISITPEIKDELEEGIDKFIIRNNIWGTDIDEFSVFMSKFTFAIKNEKIDSDNINIYLEDILLNEKNNIEDLLACKEKSQIGDIRFDLVIGNPPYIGHKKIDKSYRKQLQFYYSEVYSDKADISYCFFQRGHELLKSGGTLLFITSRYFIESPSAKGVREYINNNLTIDKIIDFYGRKVFKGIGISPAIIKCNNNENISNQVKVFRLIDKNFNISNGRYLKGFDSIKVRKSNLNSDGWLLINEEEKRLYDYINDLGRYSLSEICRCNQGIITGCDKAFIVNSKTIEQKGLEKSVIKPWIKNSGIRKYGISEIEKFIIYADMIDSIESYPNIYNHIFPYREKLKKRRECQKGLREWYQLQWGRDIEVFRNKNILFPFKAPNNRFTILYDELLCSADVYLMSIKEEYSEISLEYLLGFLNSSVCEFYFKTIAKKINDDLYDYYPNKVMNLRIKVAEDTKYIEERVKELLKLTEKKHSKGLEEINKMKIEEKQSEINAFFYDLYSLNDEQISIIKNKIIKKK
ncbi:MAG: adenine-specific DNA methylase [Firmicutes bacterium]|nr:adenine-specific DNA methylase [Bacillota bacterium]